MKIRINASIVPTDSFGASPALLEEHTGNVLGFGMKFPPDASELTPEQVSALEVAFDTDWKMVHTRIREQFRALAQDASIREEEAELAELAELRRARDRGLTLDDENLARLEALEETRGRSKGQRALEAAGEEVTA